MPPAGLLGQWVLTKVNGLGKVFALLDPDHVVVVHVRNDQGDDPLKNWKSVADGLAMAFILKINDDVHVYLYMGMSQNAVSNPGSLTRGYDSWVWFGVWFVGMIRGYDSRTLI